MNLDLAEAQIVALRRTANDLHIHHNALVQVPAAESPIPPLHATWATGHFLALVVLRSHAAEIALKAISYKRTQHYEREHDLLLLHNYLEDDIKQLIEQVGSETGIASVRDTLEAHKDDFVNWRYPAEGGDRAAPDLFDLDRVLGVLLDVYGRL